MTLIDGIYVIKDNGICFHALALEQFCEKENRVDELRSAFFNALLTFAKSEFDGDLKDITIEDKKGRDRKVYFRKLKASGLEYCIVAIFNARKNLMDIQGKILKLHMTIRDKGWVNLMRGNMIPDVKTQKEMDELITRIFI